MDDCLFSTASWNSFVISLNAIRVNYAQIAGQGKTYSKDIQVSKCGDVDTGIKVAQLDRMLGYAGLG